MDDATPLTEVELLRGRLIWADALKGVSLWEDLLFVDIRRLRGYAITTSEGSRWLMSTVIIFHCILGATAGSDSTHAEDPNPRT